MPPGVARHAPGRSSSAAGCPGHSRRRRPSARLRFERRWRTSASRPGQAAERVVIDTVTRRNALAGDSSGRPGRRIRRGRQTRSNATDGDPSGTDPRLVDRSSKERRGRTDPALRRVHVDWLVGQGGQCVVGIDAEVVDVAGARGRVRPRRVGTVVVLVAEEHPPGRLRSLRQHRRG